jgi:glycosyltransferase involved in cell wall biosynthesis
LKILVCNKFYFRHGGQESYLLSLAEMQEKHGHQVFPFSMKHERNVATEYQDFFVSNVETENLKGASLKTKLKTAARIVYSTEARKKISDLVRKIQPDVAHIHGIYHQISPSVLPVLKKNGIPTVMTVHDYKLACPNYRFYSNNRVCEKCRRTKYYQAVLNKCVKGSYAASLVCALEAYLHRLLKIYETNIDVFICPSKWLRQKMIEYGLPARKLLHVPNFVNPDDYAASWPGGNYIIYFGRIAPEKGLRTLIDAMKGIESTRLTIVGEGQVKSALEDYCRKERVSNCDFLGYRGGEELLNLVGNSQFAVLPSEWYENSPMSVLEAFACGKPVVGANIGGIPELIDDGVTGLIFEPGNAEELSQKLRVLLKAPSLIDGMGKNARRKVQEEYSAEKHYESIMGIYARLMG